MTPGSLEQYRASDQDAPLDLIRRSPAWRPVVGLIDRWARGGLGVGSGYSSEELDRISELRGVRFPPVLREWWRLAGRHPFVEPGVLPDNAKFIGPRDRSPLDPQGFLTIAVDDVQTWSCNGLHSDFFEDIDPPVHGINSTISPEDDPSLDWYKGMFIATGLSVPALIFSSLLYHLFEPSPLVRPGAVYLQMERQGLCGGQPDERLVSELGLERFASPTIVGDLYSDGGDINYWWLRGCACRSAESAERVCRTVPARRMGSA